MLLRAICLVAIVALLSCSKVPGKPDNSAAWQEPNVMPGAYLHLPPMPSPEASDSQTLPVQIYAIKRNGTRVWIAWDAPGATQASVAFSTDGRAFRTLAATALAVASITPPAPHGIIRVNVSGPGRTGSVYARL